MAEAFNSDFLGKKIFFVNPTTPIKNYVISSLRNEEMEVYIIDNYKLTKNILSKNPNSICFIYIDSDLTLNGWFVFLEDLTKDEGLKTVVTGIISDKVGEKEKTYLMEHTNLLGGIHKSGSSPIKLLEGISEVTTNEKAKGRRQYVRANCFKSKGNELIWNQDNILMQIKLVDISTSSVAAKAQPKDVPLLREKTTIRGATLKLGSKQYLVDFLIYATHQRDGNTLIIILFLQETIRALKGDLQDYVYEILQKQLMEEIELLAPDEKEYNKIGKQIKISSRKKEKETN